MLQKSRNWLNETIWKPKKPHSLEHLRYLHYVLTRNTTVNETNKGLLVETLRSIAEILIWGDQNDSTVFDFFLEKNMLLFFLKIMMQDCGTYVTVQLLQTLNILFENIRHETSLYFLLSNNHVNSIIVNKFDFTNEEVLAYYISFLKTLSLKLNLHTINFFFNAQLNDFPLYTEAIKFFNHSEGMVRIAVRTLTLNVYKVGNDAMLNFICDKTADPYFSNLVWFIGKHAIELDDCVVKESDHLKCGKLKDIVADHLDHLHYLQDILLLENEHMNRILTDHLLNRLLIPLYVYSLPSVKEENKNDRLRVSRKVALFLLSQHLLIMSHKQLMSTLVSVICNEDMSVSSQRKGSPEESRKGHSKSGSVGSIRAFIPPSDTLESQLEASGITRDSYNLNQKLQHLSKDRMSQRKNNSTFYVADSPRAKRNSSLKKTKSSSASASLRASPAPSPNLMEFKETSSLDLPDTSLDVTTESVTSVDGESCDVSSTDSLEKQETESVAQEAHDRNFLNDIFDTIDCSTSDDEAFFAVCLIYALLQNQGVEKELLESVGISPPLESVPYNELLVERLIGVLEFGARDGSQVRLVTYEMAINVLKILVISGSQSRLRDHHLAMIENVREASTLQLRNFYKNDEIFVDMFEDEYNRMKSKPMNVQYVMMDAALLLPPTTTPLTGIEFPKRLPCGEEERARRAIRVFLLTRELSLLLRDGEETDLPLSKVERPVAENDVLDLNNSDLIACTIINADRHNVRRFLVIDSNQFILVEPDTNKLGWGVVKFVALLQDVEATADKNDTRAIHVIVHRPFGARSRNLAGSGQVVSLPLLSAKFVFDDYIRCMSARQRLQRRRSELRHRKMTNIARLLELPSMAAPPSHFYSLAPYDSGGEGGNQVWSPSLRTYTQIPVSSRSAFTEKRELLKVTTQSPDSTSPQRGLAISPKHSEILKQRAYSSTGAAVTQSKVNDVRAKPNTYQNSPLRSFTLDTPPPTNKKSKQSQAQALANVLRDGDATRESLTSPETRLLDEKMRTFSVEEGEEMLEDQPVSHPTDVAMVTSCVELNGVDFERRIVCASRSAPSSPRGSRELSMAASPRPNCDVSICRVSTSMTNIPIRSSSVKQSNKGNQGPTNKTKSSAKTTKSHQRQQHAKSSRSRSRKSK